MMKRAFLSLATVGIVLFAALQLVPYGRNHSNPPVRQEPAWDSTQTRELADRSCFDCHSNQTRWLWYSNVAPVSWLIQRDVDKGRHELNFSEWNRRQEGEDAAESVKKGKMPPLMYLPLHPEAQLSNAERASLIQGLAATLGSEGEGVAGTEDGNGEESDDD